MEPAILRFNNNGHDFELTVMESITISSLLNEQPIKNGFWCYWTVKKGGRVISGLPVQDGSGTVIFFKTADEAINKAKIFMGF